MTSQATVFIVDDDPAMRRSTGELLEATGFAHESFDRASDFLERYHADQPGCLVVDLSMPGMSGMELVHHLRAKGIKLPTLIVSGTGTIPQVVEGMKLGVVDFLEKPTNPDVLLEKIRDAMELDSKQRGDAEKMAPIAAKIATLSDRELDVLKLLVAGHSSKQIAAELKIALKTVENHRAKILQKTGVLNTADLARMATIMNLK